jgi:hypothetical protein
VELERYADAIASGVGSATLTQRLEGSETERARLQREDDAAPRSNKVARFLPDLSERYERLVGDIGDALQSDVVAAREFLRGFMGDVRMIPQEGGGLVAEARLDGASLIRKCLKNQRNISFVAGRELGFEQY